MFWFASGSLAVNSVIANFKILQMSSSVCWSQSLRKAEQHTVQSRQRSISIQLAYEHDCDQLLLIPFTDDFGLLKYSTTVNYRRLTVKDKSIGSLSTLICESRWATYFIFSRGCAQNSLSALLLLFFPARTICCGRAVSEYQPSRPKEKKTKHWLHTS